MYASPSDILADDGPLAEFIEDYRPRAMQLQMAERIAEALNHQESLICEAGTGTGKTFAYLIPALLSGQKIIVSTGTKHLQDQIFSKDLPIVLRATGRHANVTVLKGRNNYLCLHKYKAIEANPLQGPLMDELAGIANWIADTNTGDLNEVLSEKSFLREQITATTDQCLGQECDYYDKCHVLKARKRAQDADIVIVNHSLLLSDMVLKETGFGELLPNIDCIIFDEAHQLSDQASQFFGITVSSRQIFELIADAEKAYRDEAADAPGLIDQLRKLEQCNYDTRRQWPKYDQRIEWSELLKNQAGMSKLHELETELENSYAYLGTLAERGKELENCCRRLLAIMNRVQDFLHDEEHKMVCWLECRGRGFLLHQTPLNIAEAFQSRLKHYDCITIYTSATLTVNNRFDHFVGQLGLDNMDAESWPSPYNYGTQSLLYLPTGMPQPGERDYTQAVIEKSIPALEASQGRAFLLFTSHRALNLAAEMLKNKLPYQLLIQGQQSRNEIIDTFRADEHSILLGTNSFWEGVDVKGTALSCVIIDKLPFAAPDDPVLKARAEKMEEAGQNPFMQFQVPLAVIQLRQGIGRLIRDEQDRGVLMICDPRLTGKSYGRVFLNSLPTMKKTRELEEVLDFFR